MTASLGSTFIDVYDRPRMTGGPPPGNLIGRETLLAQLAALIDATRAGTGGAVRLEGAPGVGKSTILAACVPSRLTCLRASGVQAEIGMPFAGLEDLLHPLVVADLLEGGTTRDPADLFRTLAAQLASAAPVVLMVDDVQWFDASLRAAIAFLARRAPRLGIGVIAAWAVRDGPVEPWPGVESLRVMDLNREDAVALARRGGLVGSVAEALVDALGGNPLALVEAPAQLSAGQRAGRALLPDPLPTGERVQEWFAQRVARLAFPVRDALLLAAAGAPAEMVAPFLGPAEDAGLVVLGGSERGFAFSHPLVRAAVYHSAAPSARRIAHLRIAQILPEPERAWQQALGAVGPDPDVAERLEQLADKAQRHGAPGTAAAVLERAVALSVAPQARLARAQYAARVAALAGKPNRALTILDGVLPLARTSPSAHADLQLLRGMVMHQGGRPRAAHALLAAEAAAVEPWDPTRAAALLVQACVALMGTGPLERVRADAARARRIAPPAVGVVAMALEAEALVGLGDHRRARELLGTVIPRLRDIDPAAPGSEILAIAGVSYTLLVDHAAAETILTQLVDRQRAVGAVTSLALPLAALSHLELRRGELLSAAMYADEAYGIAETGFAGGFADTLVLAAIAMVAAHRGDADACEWAAQRMQRIGVGQDLEFTLACAEQARGHLALSGGDAQSAVSHLQRAREHARAHGIRDPGYLGTVADLIEAWVRLGHDVQAAGALADLEVDAAQTDGRWTRAAVWRARALLCPVEALDAHVSSAIAAWDGLPLPFEVARTQLALGERLRRVRRPARARPLLAAARVAFAQMGAHMWEARAAREFEAAGGTLEQSASGERTSWPAQLTGRERDVCELVCGGRTNREVATALFISPRTVEQHLRTAYRKLDVRSRAELIAWRRRA